MGSPSFGSRLRELRDSRDLSREEVARKLDLTSTTIYRYECHGFPPSLASAEKLAEFFGVSNAWLLYGVGPKRRAA